MGWRKGNLGIGYNMVGGSKKKHIKYVQYSVIVCFTEKDPIAILQFEFILLTALSTMWKLRNFTLTLFWQKLSESNVFTKEISK